ncbi:MAG: cell wall-active antibiotics response protein LiaF [Streptococcaceae bacterium]|jgi:predicted membrane protein|nr:cell wall-active antibiotics response protein LiaF [Streptococcaceae bacterium]
MKSLKWFFIIEAILFLFALRTMFSSKLLVGLLLLSLLSLLLLRRIGRRLGWGKEMRFFYLFPIIILGILFISNFFIWMMLVVAFLYLFLDEESGIPFSKVKFEKDFEMVELVEPTPKSGKKMKQTVFRATSIGESQFEWDDIHLSLFAGDTIIDLGKTILPNTDNVIILHQVFGKIRILVPTDVGVSISHSQVIGELRFFDEVTVLKNENIQQFSDDYDQMQKKIKIYTNMFIGECEVSRV